MEQSAKIYGDLDRILVTKDEIDRKVKELGKKITADYAGKEPVLVCILKGAVIFFSDLIREIDLPLTADFMAISSYGSATKTSGVVRVLKDLDKDILGKDVIIVEDIIDSGRTLSTLVEYLKMKGCRSVKTCTMLDKPARREVEFDPDYTGLVIPDEFVIGFGLDYAEKYRELPYVGILKPSVYTKKESME